MVVALRWPPPRSPIVKMRFGGRMKGSVQIHGDIFSTGEKWDAECEW